MFARRFKNLLLAAVVAVPVPPAGMPVLGPTSTPEDILRCERQIIYRGKKVACDSPSTRDGEGLRMLFADTPEALAQLNQYQETRRSLTSTAYFGMAGLLIAALGPRFASNSGNRTIWIGSGLTLTLASFAYGKAKLNANEDHLDQAIETFNRTHPGDPMELKRQ